jgi:hypothetical protein
MMTILETSAQQGERITPRKRQVLTVQGAIETLQSVHGIMLGHIKQTARA